MPGKVNPVMSEMLTQIAAQVIGNDAVITIGCPGRQFRAQRDDPRHDREPAELDRDPGERLAAVCGALRRRPQGQPPTKCADLLEKSPISATALNPIHRLRPRAKLIKEALAKKASVKQLAIDQGLITKEQADKVFDFRKMTEPGETGVGAG